MNGGGSARLARYSSIPGELGDDGEVLLLERDDGVAIQLATTNTSKHLGCIRMYLSEDQWLELVDAILDEIAENRSEL